MSLENRSISRQLLTGLGAALCIASFFAWDAMHSVSMAQAPSSTRCDGERAREDWLDGLRGQREQREIRRVRSALEDLVAAVHRYTDADFGGKDTRQKFSDYSDDAIRQLEQLINEAALGSPDSTQACRVCRLTEVYEKAREVGEGDRVTLQELAERSDLFYALAADKEQIQRRSRELQDMRGRADASSQAEDALRDAIRALSKHMDDLHKQLADFRKTEDPKSQKMAAVRDQYVCERMRLP